MLSKTSSSTRFWHHVALIAFMAVAEVGCGGGGGGTGGGGGGSPGGPDAAAPHFAGLKAVSQDNGNVVVTSDEGSDDVTPKDQLTYLIYASTVFPVDKTAPHLTATGAQACANGSCNFAINDLVKDGKTKYYFASNVKDISGNVDADAHAKETADLSLSPFTEVNTGTNHPNITPTGVNASPDPAAPPPTTHATHPGIVTLKGIPYVIWEDCADAPGTPSASADHPCNIADASKIFVRHWDGTNWVHDTDDNGLQGNATVAAQSIVHRHAPTLASDGTFVYASWEESWKGNEVPTPQAHKAIYINSFNGTQWSGPTKIAGDGGSPARPALTTVAAGTQPGIGYEISPACCSYAQLFFKRPGEAGNGVLLNKDFNNKAEAAAFSRNAGPLFVAWKETALTAGATPNIFVRMLNSTGGWDLIGPAGGEASLNMNTQHEARLPSVDVMGATPYVAWHECLETGCGNRHIFVKHWDGAQWVQDKDTGTCAVAPTDCGSLNVNSITAETPSVAVLGNQVFISWAERNDLTSPPVYKIQLKSLIGTQWSFHGTRNTVADRDGFSPMLYADNTDGTGLYTVWVEKGPNNILQLHVK